MCYRIKEVRNGKNALGHLDISLGFFCANTFSGAFSEFLVHVTKDLLFIVLFIHFFRMVFAHS